MQVFETKEQIKTRILTDMAREWGYRGMSEIDLSSFDPVVDLLVGACSYEIERLSHDITNSQNRIFERLIEVLTPDVMTKAQPAYAIAHAKPTEPIYITEKTDQFFYKHPEIKKDIFFSAAGDFRLTDTQLTYIAFDNRIMKFNERLGKDPLLEAEYGKYLHAEHIYLGITVHPDVQTLEHLSLFFDWKNQTQINTFLNYLPLAEWSVSGVSIETRSGWSYKKPSANQEDEDIFSSMGLEKYIQQNILSACQKHFISITDANLSITQHSNNMPKTFSAVFLKEHLDTLEQSVLWIKIKLPNALRGHIADMDCALNCFPVINRQLHTRQEKLKDELFIMPIEVDQEYFLSVESMTNSNQVAYKEVPLKIINEDDHGMYAIRDRGVSRFDSREAGHLLNYTLDMVRHEAAAYRGLGYATVSADLADLDVVFKRIEKNFHRSKSDLIKTTYLFIRPFRQDQQIYLSYWTTNGAQANRIAHGTPLKLFSNVNLQANSVFLMTTSQSGREKMQAVDSVNAFKEIVMTRGRIVTKEDIRSFCINQIGARNIEKIEIKNGTLVSGIAKEGLIRTIDVHIYRASTSNVDQETWVRLCNETEIKLTHLSTAVFPIRISSKQMQAHE